MRVKGTAIKANQLYVQATFGEEGLARWLTALPEASRAILSGKVLDASWYPVGDAVLAPTLALCQLFFDGDTARGARAVGRFNAEHGLRGIYRIFVKMAPPGVVIEMGSKIIRTYYDSIEMFISEKTKHGFRLEFTKMDEPSLVIDHRIAGWIERGIQICGSEGVQIEVVASASGPDERTVIVGSWD